MFLSLKKNLKWHQSSFRHLRVCTCLPVTEFFMLYFRCVRLYVCTFVNVCTSLCVFAHVWEISQVTHVNRIFSLQVNPVELYCCCKLWWVMSDDTAVDWQRLNSESELFCYTLHLTTQILIKRTCSCQNISAHQQVWLSQKEPIRWNLTNAKRSRRGITTVILLTYVCHCHFSLVFLRHVVPWCKTTQ